MLSEASGGQISIQGRYGTVRKPVIEPRKQPTKIREHSVSETKRKITKLRENNVKYSKGSSKMKSERCSLVLCHW